jgi:hypothetical protein
LGRGRPGRRIKDLRFADHIDLLTETEDLQKLTKKLYLIMVNKEKVNVMANEERCSG